MSVSVNGADQLRRALTQIVKSTQKKAIGQVRLSTKRVASEAKRKAPKAFGVLRGSITATFERGGLDGVIKAEAPYARWVEGETNAQIGFGTGQSRYGRRPGKWPPVEPIRRWVVIKGLAKKWNMSEFSATFLVRRKIGLEGTPAQPFLFPAYNRELPVFKEAIERIVDDAARSAESARGAFA